jgi:heat shock protein HtpX
LTQGLLEALNHEELKGVIAHELGHIVSRDTLTGTVVAAVAGTVSALAMTLRCSLSGGRSRSANPILWLLFALLLPVAAALVKLAISRSREYEADEWGARLCGNPLYLAGALQKISLRIRKNPMAGVNPGMAHLFIANPLTGVNFSRLFASHPPIESRIVRLEAMARRRT